MEPDNEGLAAALELIRSLSKESRKMLCEMYLTEEERKEIIASVDT